MSLTRLEDLEGRQLLSGGIGTAQTVGPQAALAIVEGLSPANGALRAAALPTAVQVANAIGGVARGELINALTGVSYSGSDNWGNQIKTPFGKKNHGTWTRYDGAPSNLNETIVFTVSNAKVKKTTLTFDVFVKVQVRVNAEVRIYNRGVRLLEVSGSGRQDVEGRFSFAITRTSRTALNLTTTRSDVQLKRLELDRIGHLGGEAARLVGDTITGAVRKWKPNIIQDVQSRANDSVVNTVQGDVDVKKLVLKALGA